MGGFPRGFSCQVKDLSPSHIFIVIPTAGGKASQPRHSRGSSPPGGRPNGIRRGRPRMYEYGYDTLWVGARIGSWDTHVQISSELLGLTFTPKGLSWLETSCNTVGNRPSVPPAGSV